MRTLSFVCAASLIALSACKSAPAPHAVTPALQKIVAGNPAAKVEPAIWTDVRAFYIQRQDAPAWVDHRRPTDKAAKVIALLNTARQHGFDPKDYSAPELLDLSQAVEKIDKESPERLERLAEFDARMTASLFAFGRDVAVGRQHGDANWKARRKTPDLGAAVAKAADNPDEFIDLVRPPHAEYAALQKALDDLNGQKEKSGWVEVPSAQSTEELRQRLTASGQLKPGAGNREPGAAELAAAVKAFQALHQLPETGVVDKATLEALNVPLDWRIQQVAINLQRWRYMPDDLGEQHFLVNIPHYHLVARESGKPVMDIRVVVGKPGNNTPIFSEDMETVVFSPYWNIPDTIAESETAPAIARDPNYLARQGIEILRVSANGSQTLNASDVDWGNSESLKGLAFRQRPGAGNALGHVKFLFPNKHNVYLHDTPADSLFAKPSRAFSHGCVRVEEPETLAKYVLKDDPEWTESAIFAAMNSGNEQHVKLKKKIPVHIVYFTSWVDENGGLHFQPDIYGYDRDNGN
ncbi:MAG: L,D-transpeptidase family protein [Cyanobacteria bacterium]|nr:L,D-transpeptidase family protein [Cyanobacteriota bacterium]